MDWDAWDRVGEAQELDVPILLFHRDSDRTNPVEVSLRRGSPRPCAGGEGTIGPTREWWISIAAGSAVLGLAVLAP